jgi:hypothetical protein
MVIDIEEDKVVIDEFCDAIVAGVATNGGSLEDTKGKELLASKSDLFAGIAVVGAAEKAIMRQKREFVKSFMQNVSPEDIAAALNMEEDVEDEC